MKIPDTLLDVLDAGATKLEELIHLYPSLSNSAIESSLSNWHRYKIEIRLHEMGEGGNTQVASAQNLLELATELLKDNSLEETRETLVDVHGIDISLAKLAHVIGRDVYTQQLRKDARQLVSNAISYEQIANLWNDLGRPALGGHPKWSGRNVSILIN